MNKVIQLLVTIVSETDKGKYDLGDFLSKELLTFFNDVSDVLSTRSHVYQNNSCNNFLSKDIDSLLLQAIENYKDFNEQASSTIFRDHFLTLSAEKTLNK